MRLEVFTIRQNKLQNALSRIFPTVLLLPPSCHEIPPCCSLSFSFFTCFLSVVFTCFDHLPTLITWRDQTPLRFLLRKERKKERMEKKENKKPQDFLPLVCTSGFSKKRKEFLAKFPILPYLLSVCYFTRTIVLLCDFSKLWFT